MVERLQEVLLGVVVQSVLDIRHLFHPLPELRQSLACEQRSLDSNICNSQLLLLKLGKHIKIIPTDQQFFSICNTDKFKSIFICCRVGGRQVIKCLRQEATNVLHTLDNGNAVLKHFFQHILGLTTMAIDITFFSLF